MKPRFTVINKLAIMLLFLLSFGNMAKASHYAAADMNIQYVGDVSNQLLYRIVLQTFKACEVGAIDLSDFETITLRSANGGFNQSWTLGVEATDTLDQLCDNFKSQNSCRFPTSSFPAFIRKTFDTTLSFPSRQTDWVASWTNGSRNGGIANLVTPSFWNIYIEAGVNNVINPTNSSPKFTIDPLPYMCANYVTTYLSGAFDVDGDSLDVKNQAPLQAANTPIAHIAPYTVANPVNSVTGYNVDPFTGSALFTAPSTGKYVLAFRCDEYQRGTGIPTGYIMRDVQVSVLPCNSPPPAIDTVPSNIQFGTMVVKDGRRLVLACPNNAITFDVSAASLSLSNKVYLQSTTGSTIPGSTFNVANNGTAKVTGTFTWTPTLADLGEHTVQVIASDSTCDNNISLVLKSYLAFTIKVIDGIEVGEDVTVCPEGGTAFPMFVKGAEGLTVKWTDINGGPAIGISNPDIIDPLAKPSVQTTYVVTSSLPGYCKNKDTVTVFMDTTNKVNVTPENPVIVCRPDYLQMDAIPSGLPPISNMACGLVNTSKCDIPDSLAVYGLLTPKSFDTLGGTTPTFPNDVPSTKQQFLMRKAEMFRSGLLSASIKSLSFEVSALSPVLTYEYSNLRISLKCTDKTALDPAKGFETGMVPVYAAPGPVLLDGGWEQFLFDAPYNWDTSKNLIIEICYSQNATVEPVGNNPIVRFVPTNYIAGLTYKAISPSTNACATTTATIGMGTNYGRPLFGFTYCEAPSIPFKYTWSPGTLLSDSTIQQPLAYVPKSIKYVVRTMGRSGCIIKDSADIYIPVHDYSVTPADTAICFGETAPLHAKNGFTYKWYEYKDGVYTLATRNSDCWECAEPILRPQATTIYKIVVYDSVWCTDTLTARVEVMPLPDIKILNRDTVVKYGKALQLMVSGARMYNWLNPSSLSNTNVANPIARPTEPTQYVVGGIGRNGCRAFDTLNVDVDYRDNLFIPSAFSPNGDGKNDVFKISNLSFQRVMEFRVFNRWGQEVFYSNDNEHGWDGNWKGVPQDMGSYTYMVRLGYPDGLVESFKGEVTLVR